MTRALRKLLEPLRNRVMLMVARGVVRLVDDGKLLQALQVSFLPGEVRDRLERFGSYGFTSAPHPGAEAVAVFVGGNRDHGLVIAVDDRRYRLRALEEGEVALYDDLGSKVHLRRGGEIEVVATTAVRLVAPLTNVAGDLHVEGDLTSEGDVTDRSTGGGLSMAAMRTVYNGHTHPPSNNPPSPPMS